MKFAHFDLFVCLLTAIPVKKNEMGRKGRLFGSVFPKIYKGIFTRDL